MTTYIDIESYLEQSNISVKDWANTLKATNAWFSGVHDKPWYHFKTFSKSGDQYVDLPASIAFEVRQWCEDTFGPSGHGGLNRWRRSYESNRIIIKSEEDIAWFLLRWS